MLQISDLRHRVRETAIARTGQARKSAILPLARFLLYRQESQRGYTVIRSIPLVFIGLTLAGCIEVTVVDAKTSSEPRLLPPFEKVEASRGVAVTLRCGASASATLRGDLDDIANTELSVDKGVLTVRRASIFGDYHRTLHVEVTAPGPIVGIATHNGASLDAPACVLSGDRLTLDASSGSTIHLAADVRHLVADTDSGAAIRPLEGVRIDAAEAEITAASGSTMRLCKVDHLTASASSGATLTTESIGSGDSRASSGGSLSMKKCW